MPISNKDDNTDLILKPFHINTYESTADFKIIINSCTKITI